MIRKFGRMLAVGLVLVASALAANLVPQRTAIVEREPVAIRTAAPVYMANGKVLTNVHEVIGRIKGTSPITVTLSGGARFYATDTYFCMVSGADENQTLGPQVINVHGSQFQIVHGSADAATVTYRCLGM